MKGLRATADTSISMYNCLKAMYAEMKETVEAYNKMVLETNNQLARCKALAKFISDEALLAGDNTSAKEAEALRKQMEGMHNASPSTTVNISFNDEDFI
jgi:hypothetical protein